MEEVVVLIIGAGPAGLATAACLALQHVAYANIERESCTVLLWCHHTYDRLKLHLAKEICELPHMAYPSGTLTYPRYDTFVESATYDQGKKHWAVLAQDTDIGVVARLNAWFLIVATSENNAASIPAVPASPEAIHSSAYKSGKGYTGKSVLVVGAGNSGMEIAYDLATHGAHTSIVVRRPVYIMTKELIRFGMTIVQNLGLPVTTVDSLLVMHGIMRPKMGPLLLKSQTNRSAVIDAGTAKLITRGIIDNGESMFRNDGFPKKKFPNHWRGENGLYCAGFARRGLAGIAMDAKNIVDDIIATMDQVYC
uniref:indole-3-pyruvate monooxygenase n=1 Tax=Oryza punctata TaxID=4537 RepID=A0A0E0JYB4_ORYPU